MAYVWAPTSNGSTPLRVQQSPARSNSTSKVTSLALAIAISPRFVPASLPFGWRGIRIDRRLNEKTSAFALFGQDWTPFVSSTMPNIIENTNFGGLGYGAAYTRAPQTRFGLNFGLGGSLKFGPEIAIVLPAFGNLPSDVGNQLAFGERQGVDSQQPGVQGRAVLQWQLDKAASVSPAQFIVSFEHAKRTAIVTAANVPAAFKAAFPGGAEESSTSNGYSVELQLPTRFVTAVGKYYSGSDLRFFFAGQLLSNFNDTAGLTSTASVASIDGSSTVVFGLLNGAPVVAPQRPVRGQGGFVQLGFPLSRIFNANQKDVMRAGPRSSTTATIKRLLAMRDVSEREAHAAISSPETFNTS